MTMRSPFAQSSPHVCQLVSSHSPHRHKRLVQPCVKRWSEIFSPITVSIMSVSIMRMERAVVSKSVLLYRGSLAAAAAAVIVGLLPTPAGADPAPVPSNPGWTVTTLLSGSSLHHQLPNGSSEALKGPDDLT